MNVKIELSNIMGKTILQMTANNQADIDPIAVKMLHNDCPDFVAPFSLVEINGETIFRYEIGNLISLEYFGTTLPLSDFTRLLKNLAAPLTDCTDWMLDYRLFCYDLKYIFIDRYTYEIKYVYYPLLQCNFEDNTVKNVFKSTMKLCGQTDSKDLQVDLYQLYSNDDFSISDLTAIVLKHSSGVANNIKSTQNTNSVVSNKPMQAVTPIKATPQSIANNMSHSLPITQKAVPAFEAATPVNAPVIVNNSANMTDEELLEAQILQGFNMKPKKVPQNKKTKQQAVEKQKKPLFGGFGKKAAPANVPQKEVLSGAPKEYLDNVVAAQNFAARPAVNNNSDSVTEIFDASSSSSVYLSLVKNSPNNLDRHIDLDFSKGCVTVGRFDAKKGVKQNDIEFPTQAKSVSRIHARLEVQNGEYFVIDLGSANGTFVNGQKLASSVPYNLNNGDCIGFSEKDIDYIFNV